MRPLKYRPTGPRNPCRHLLHGRRPLSTAGPLDITVTTYYRRFDKVDLCHKIWSWLTGTSLVGVRWFPRLHVRRILDFMETGLRGPYRLLVSEPLTSVDTSLNRNGGVCTLN